MAEVNEMNQVFRKIKEISVRNVKPRTAIPIDSVLKELTIEKEVLMTHIEGLCELKLIKYDQQPEESINLTYLGTMVKR